MLLLAAVSILTTFTKLFNVAIATEERLRARWKLDVSRMPDSTLFHSAALCSLPTG